MTVTRCLPLLLMLLLPAALHSQYWGERVLEKSFEQTEFFYSPSYLNPYGIGSFRSVTSGFVDDPLLNVIANPARLDLDSLEDHYLYTDFRGAREVKERETGVYPLWLDARTASVARPWYYPQVYLNTRRELEPVFSGAYIGRPLPFLAHDLLVGVTYQHVTQDEKYYSIPQDIYRSVAGLDYSGREVAAAGSIPIVDRFSGKDNMHQSGHFLTGYLRFALFDRLELGAKASRAWFSRAGAVGSSNLWGPYQSSSGTSLWSSFEDRDQTYRHWDVAAGAGYRLTDGITIGGSVGHLWGTAAQDLHDSDTSFHSSSYSYPNSSSGSSYYNRSGNTLNRWRHNGKTTYIGGDLSARLSARTVLNLFYQHRRTSVNIALNSGILDTSYSTYSWADNANASSTSYSRSYLSDQRTGSGTQRQTSDRATASVQWDVSAKVKLSLGTQVEWQTGETRTGESVLAENRSAYWSTRPEYYSSAYENREVKDLLWTFTSERFTFQVPVFVTVKPTEGLDVLFGVNRTMTRWKMEDVTLAVIHDRTNVVNGQRTQKGGFGERYTEPAVEVTDIRTSVLAGLVVTPSSPLRIRLLVVPAFHDTYEGSELEQLQWWIGLTLTP